MQSIDVKVPDLLRKANERLVNLQERLRDWGSAPVEEMVPKLDRDLRYTYESIESIRRYLVLCRTPAYRRYLPIDLVRSVGGQSVRPHDSLAPESPVYLLGDVEQIAECLRLVLWNMSASHNAPLTMRLFLDGENARVEVEAGSERPAPASFALGPDLSVGFDELKSAWATATRGGKMTHGQYVLTLHFTGNCRARAGCSAANELLAHVWAASQCLSPWRGAIGQFESGLVADSDVGVLYAKPVGEALRRIEMAVGTANTSGR